MDRIYARNMANNLCGIYKIISPTNRVYIGQSRNIRNRYKSHCRPLKGSKTKLSRSFIKYGIENHQFEILELCDIGELDNKERHYFEVFNSIEDGLNIIDRGYTLIDTKNMGKNTIWTDERKHIHSEFLKKWWRENPDFSRGEAWKHKMSEISMGMVVAKNLKGEFVKVTQSEYDSNPNLVGTTMNTKQPKLSKKVRCITDDIIFDSIIGASTYYGFMNSSNIIESIKHGIPMGKVKLNREIFFEYYNDLL